MTVIDTVSKLFREFWLLKLRMKMSRILTDFWSIRRDCCSWHDKPIPDVLISGHHAKIEQWKREQSLINTLKKRPDMLEKAELTKEDIKFLKEYK